MRIWSMRYNVGKHAFRSLTPMLSKTQRSIQAINFLDYWTTKYFLSPYSRALQLGFL